MSKYRQINNLTGWIVFAIATIVYTLSVEPTASYWDCGEFIACAFKLQVPHPPGAPFFLMMGRMFSLFAPDLDSVALMINMMSVLASGFTILFLFWSITLIGRKLVGIKDFAQATTGQTYALMGAGVIGALAYTFSDTFWFSAVEAEVYAMSSFFTAFVFWAILRWEVVENESQANKWLILIAYMIGLSVGVHLLNLVTLPALAMIYYFKRHTFSWPGLIAALAISGAMVIFIMSGIITGLPGLAGDMEIFFVNSLGLPFGSGVILFILLLVGALVYGIYITQAKGLVTWNTLLLGFAFILIGDMSYAMAVIRSNLNPPIDQNNPENIISYLSYLRREQYGDRPLFFGPYYTAEIVEREEGRDVYVKGEEKYEVAYSRPEYKYDPKQSTILPRIYSDAENHVQAYQSTLGLRDGEVPGFGDNLRFMFKHQIGHMYLRYFMWNFAGRASDQQDAGWLSPAAAFEDVPDELAENKARNNYFMLPLILGLVGLFFHLKRDEKSFAVVAMLFFLTGVALVLYLNSPPIEPRERDYIYAGSFYVFAIWIGFGVLAIWNLIRKTGEKPAAIGATAVCLVVPVIMATENWNDHDRSGRFFSVDQAKNYLASTADQAILFTGGDNDTFPLWYMQDVEGYRTDARVIVGTYYNTDWYIQQTMQQMQDSPPFPYTLSYEHYAPGVNDFVLVRENPKLAAGINAEQYLKLVKEGSDFIKQRAPGQGEYTILPSRKLYINVNKDKLIENGIVSPKLRDKIVDRIEFEAKGGALYKKDLALLDLIVTNNAQGWTRPIYFTNTSRMGLSYTLEDYLVQEGNAYRLLPVKNDRPNTDMVDTERMYDNMMNKFAFRNLNDPGAYYNDDYMKSVANNRTSFNELAAALINEGDSARAKEVLNYSLEVMPDKAVHYDLSTVETVRLLFRLGENEMANEIARTYGDRLIDMLEYNLDNGDLGMVTQSYLYYFDRLIRSLAASGNDELVKSYSEEMDRIYGKFQNTRR
ncbi:protein O-mannosyl-transferase family [Roseivirga sp. BDSF3-8]|uniref:protein O-mannosyl-transferase family n=1 Tax=Roseivirga sp. BDSF3-8 TaxID=3241598 RepID=UPI00353230BA